ncbi:hypothetical protein CYMTET_44508 [Cymbomonas tetramitiformis]|uniref:Uncharacterized protein n=1 Tax=Cymbomonas tetramitiformis TaxID=36881 RepID=A0AAE0F0L6_9CHLO|nr:hypothetical protein CYMTET_44508 [Cymbomonas tetramitiformis]
MNEDHLLFAGALVDLQASNNLDLFENAKLSASSVPTTTLCTCDFNLLIVLQEAERAQEPYLTNDVQYDEDVGVARRRTLPPPPPSSRRLMTLNDTGVQNRSVDDMSPMAVAFRRSRRTELVGTHCATHMDCQSRSDVVCHNPNTLDNGVTLCAGCPRPVMASGAAPRRCDALRKVCVCGAPREIHNDVARAGGYSETDESKFQFLLDPLLWSGDTQCDHLLRALSARVPAASLRSLGDVEAGLAWHCVRARFHGMELASALEMPTLPTDLFYNPLRGLDLARTVIQGLLLMWLELPTNVSLTTEIAMYDQRGLDAQLMLRLRAAFVDPLRSAWSAEWTHLSEAANLTSLPGALPNTTQVALNGTGNMLANAINITRQVGTHVGAHHSRALQPNGTAAYHAVHAAVSSVYLAIRARWYNRSRLHGDREYGAFFAKQYPLSGRHPLVEPKSTAHNTGVTGAPDAPPVAFASPRTGRRLAQYLNSTDGAGTLYAHVRTADCALTDRVMDAAGDVMTYASQYYSVRQNLNDTGYNHTFQHSVCALLRAANFLPMPETIVQLTDSCHTDTTLVARALRGRSPYQLAKEELARTRTWVDRSVSNTERSRNDLTRTDPRAIKADASEGCSKQTATRMVLCYGQSLVRNVVPSFDVDADVTTFFINRLFQQTNDTTADDDARSINNISLYSTDFIGVYYLSDQGSGLRSEHLVVNDSVRFWTRYVRRRVGNRPAGEDDAGTWVAWYQRWAERGFTNEQGVSTVILRNRTTGRYIDFNFYDYRQAESNETYWMEDVATRGGYVPAQLFAAACELREEDPMATFDERTLCNADYYGPRTLRAWAKNGYGSLADNGPWYKDEVDFADDLRNAPRNQRLAQLVPNLDYPDPPILLRYGAASATILRYDDYTTDYYEDAAARSAVYLCTCTDRYADEAACLTARTCAAVRANSTHDFVYDHGVWWDCKASRAIHPIADWPHRACYPVYHRSIDTVATTRALRVVHTARDSDRSAGTCEQRGVLDCGRRNFDWPIVPTAIVNTFVGVALGAPVVYFGGSASAPYVAAVGSALVLYSTLRTTYDWQIDCFPAMPTCLADDIVTDLETYLIPNHIHWPITWAERDSATGRLVYNNVDCASDPYGFVDGFRNAMYLWERDASSSLEDFRSDRRTKWLASILRSYVHYYDELHGMSEAVRERMDACHDRTMLNYGPVAMLAVIVVVVIMYALAIGLMLTFNFVAVYSELRQVMEYALIVSENRVYARTLQKAIREVTTKVE